MYDNISNVRLVSQKMLGWAIMSNLNDDNFTRAILKTKANHSDSINYNPHIIECGIPHHKNDMSVLESKIKKIYNKALELENIIAHYYQLDKTFLTSVNIYIKHIIKFILHISYDTYIGFYSINMKNLLLNVESFKIININMRELSPEIFENNLLDDNDKLKMQRLYDNEIDSLINIYDYLYWRSDQFEIQLPSVSTTYSQNLKSYCLEQVDAITELYITTFVNKYGQHPLTKTVFFIDKGTIGNKYLYKGYNIDIRVLIKAYITKINPITNTFLYEKTCEKIVECYDIEIKLLSIYLTNGESS